MTRCVVILASQSPRRRELLTLVGIAHEVQPADIDETPLPDEQPVPHARTPGARRRRTAIAIAAPDALVIAADTIVVIDDDDPRQARRRGGGARDARARLSGRDPRGLHRDGGRAAASASKREAVRVRGALPRASTTQRSHATWTTGEPMDKAGAYGIQGYGATIVEHIEGDYFAVMGLSLVTVVQLAERLKCAYEFGPLSPR